GLAEVVLKRLKFMLAMDADELIKLYDDDDLRDRLGGFLNAPRTNPESFEDVQKRLAEKRPIIAEQIFGTSAWPVAASLREETKRVLQALIDRIKGLDSKRRLIGQ